MTLEEALKTIDPDTGYKVLETYGNKSKQSAAKSEAVRIVFGAYKALFRDLAYVCKTSQNFDCSCKLCTGGMGYGNCCWPDGTDMPIDACEKCGKCRCAQCVDRSE